MKRSFIAMAMMLCLLAAGVALADGVQQDKQRGPTGVFVGDSLLEARAKLLKQGWIPTRRHATGNYEYMGAERQLKARRCACLFLIEINRKFTCHRPSSF
jgi:opacity protein-like surface antigen